MASTILTLLDQSSAQPVAGRSTVSTRELLVSSASTEACNDEKFQVKLDFIKGTYLLHRSNLRNMQITGIVTEGFPFERQFSDDADLDTEICTQRAKLDLWYAKEKLALTMPVSMEHSEDEEDEDDDEYVADVFQLDTHNTQGVIENGLRVSAWLGTWSLDACHVPAFTLCEYALFKNMASFTLCPGDSFFRHDYHIVMHVLQPNMDYYMNTQGTLSIHTDATVPGIIVYRQGFERATAAYPVLYCNNVTKLSALFVDWLKKIKCPWSPAGGAKPLVSRFFNLTASNPAFELRKRQIKLT